MLTKLVVELLRETTGYSVMVDREPGGTDLGEQIRHLLKNESFRDMHPLTSAYLFSAQRSELFHKVETKFLQENTLGILVKDRSWLSTVVLQVAEGADPEYIEILQKPFVSIPQKFVIIDIPVEETVVRMEAAFRYSSEREVDWRDKQTQELLGRYRDNYLSFAAKNRDKVLVLDCFDDPWDKAGRIKLEAVRTLMAQEGKVLSGDEGNQLHNIFSGEAKRIVDLDSERPVLRVYDINDRRKQVREVRQKLAYPSIDELRIKMHDEWRARGLEGFSSGIERGK